MRRERPSRPKPQSVVTTSRSGGMYSNARRISAATCSGGSTTVLQWLTTPIPIFLSVLYLPNSGSSLPSLQQMRQRPLIARHLPIDALLVGVAPAGMHPHLGVDPDKLAVERLGLEFEV